MKKAPLPNPAQPSSRTTVEKEVNFRRILVPVDCSSRSERLLGKAAAFARRLDAELVLLHVHRGIEFAPPLCTPAQLDQQLMGLEQAATSRLEQLKAEFANEPAVQNARAIVACGSLSDEVLSVARTVGADLILVSTHGRCGLRHLFAGSKAEGILREACCPVLVIPDRCGHE